MKSSEIRWTVLVVISVIVSMIGFRFAINSNSPNTEGGDLTLAGETATLPSFSFVSGELHYTLKKEMNVSAYCPCAHCCGRFADGITASGHHIQPRDKFVAAPPEYPFGTMMDIPGYGIALVFDRGGAIKGNKLDLFFHSHQEALNWGRQKLTVTVYGKTKGGE